MSTLPNLLSLSRIFFALLVLYPDERVRVLSILLAALSDSLDGFLARRMGWTSRIGALIDPLTDRFFALFVMGVFFFEGKLELWQGGLMLVRDASVVVFGLYLLVMGRLSNWRVRAIYCGKVTTFLQFLVLFLMALGVEVPDGFYFAFLVVGVLALFELLLLKGAGVLARRDSTIGSG